MYLSSHFELPQSKEAKVSLSVLVRLREPVKSSLIVVSQHNKQRINVDMIWHMVCGLLLIMAIMVSDCLKASSTKLFNRLVKRRRRRRRRRSIRRRKMVARGMCQDRPIELDQSELAHLLAATGANCNLLFKTIYITVISLNLPLCHSTTIYVRAIIIIASNYQILNSER